MTRRFLIVFLLFLTTLPARAADPEPETIKRHRINIGKLRQEIRLHLDKIRESGEQEMSLLEELERIDRQMTAQREKLAALRKRLESQKALLVLKEKDLDQAEQARENVRRHLEKRLRAYYMMGRTGFLNVTFSRKSLPELVLFNESYTRLLEYNQSVIEMYRETIDQLQRARKALELEKRLLEEFVAQAAQQEERLQRIREKKDALLTRVRTQKKLHEQAVREMQKAEADLTKTLLRLKERAENRSRGFARMKGRLEPPVLGQLSAGFGETLADGTTCRGIIVKTARNAPVSTVYEGRVLFAGYRRGYGNMVIVDHGLLHYTITAHLDSLKVKEGDQVRTGQVIGTTGDLATLFTRGLYFEIRHGADPLDPLKWLRPGCFPRLIPLPLPRVTPLPGHGRGSDGSGVEPDRPGSASADGKGSAAPKAESPADSPEDGSGGQGNRTGSAQ